MSPAMLREVLHTVFVSSREEPRDGEAANLVDALFAIARAIEKVADGICPHDAAEGKDATGGVVGSLTEATMGITAGLVRTSESISRLVEVVGKMDD